MSSQPSSSTPIPYSKPSACLPVRSFEVRKSLHMLAIPAFIALAFHHQRLRYFAGILLVAYGLDWVYSNVVKVSLHVVLGYVN